MCSRQSLSKFLQTVCKVASEDSFAWINDVCIIESNELIHRLAFLDRTPTGYLVDILALLIYVYIYMLKEYTISLLIQYIFGKCTPNLFLF